MTIVHFRSTEIDDARPNNIDADFEVLDICGVRDFLLS